MSYNTLILSYNKNKEIEEYIPDKSPCVSSNESKDNNELIYHSFYLPNKISLNQDRFSTINILRSNTNVNLFKSYSSSPFVLSTNIKNTDNEKKTKTVYNPKIKKFLDKKKFSSNTLKNNTNNNINNKNKLQKLRKNNINIIGNKNQEKNN